MIEDDAEHRSFVRERRAKGHLRAMQYRLLQSGAAAELAQNPDVQEFYLGAGAGVDYQAVKHYRRRKRWLT